ncbi:MAG: hypothetical protein FWE08_07480 [Oscillospiraceae bacterium]|nr:hypothetical protein [Oscillospiraceae bacterium]
MKEIIIVGHGAFPVGLKNAAEMILGERDDLHCQGMTEDMGGHGFIEAISKLLDTIKGDEVIVFADVLGGSPLNNTVTCLHERGLLEKSLIFTGANLPSLVSAISNVEDCTLTELKEQILAEQETFFSLIEL